MRTYRVRFTKEAIVSFDCEENEPDDREIVAEADTGVAELVDWEIQKL